MADLDRIEDRLDTIEDKVESSIVIDEKLSELTALIAQQCKNAQDDVGTLTTEVHALRLKVQAISTAVELWNPRRN